MVFINLTNHPSALWHEDQIRAAETYGRIVDYPFPQVDPDSTEEQIEQLSLDIFSRISAINPKAVLCQGEFTLAFTLVSKFKQAGITVIAACSKRESTEILDSENGSVGVSKIFKFVKFRRY